jgi:diguanylate cyclase (GGDEF)-like protein
MYILHEEIKNAANNNFNVAIFFIDIDNFKELNDTFGFEFGDKLLTEISERIFNLNNSNEVLFRYGGDEFALVKSNYVNIDDLKQKAEQLIDEINNGIIIKGRKIYVTISIGISNYSSSCSNYDQMLRQAEMAMYKCKKVKKDNYSFFNKDMNDEIFKKVTMEMEMRKAFDENRFMLHYQPLIDLKSERIIGTEALIRWKHPQKGFIEPSEFIPIAEKTGFIISLGEWIIRTACKQNKLWQKKGYSPIYISINISAIQLTQTNFVEMIRKVLYDTKLNPKYLIFEITETTLMKSMKEDINIIKELKEIGIKIAIDDFGTGYSSLNYFRIVPADIIKIDKSFIDNVCLNSYEAAITEGIINITHKMNLSVIAEGVEKQNQLEFLKNNQCDIIQGYLYGKPMESKEMLKQFNKFAL